jgi:hypothetical protein
MAENGGRGRWLSPAEAIAEGLVDALDSELVQTTEPQTLTERAKSGVVALLRAVCIELGDKQPIVEDEDINYTHSPIPENRADGSEVAFEEAQHMAKPTSGKPTADPSPTEHNNDPRHRAYESDIRSIKRLFN